VQRCRRMLPRAARSSQQLLRCLRCLCPPLAAAARPVRLHASTLAAGSMSSQPKPGIFYRKPLPNPPCIPFSSEQGRSIFQQALAAGSLNCFFPLSEQFLTQDDPAFCGLSSMAMVRASAPIVTLRSRSSLTLRLGPQRSQHRPRAPVEGRVAMVQRDAAAGASNCTQHDSPPRSRCAAVLRRQRHRAPTRRHFRPGWGLGLGLG
jgi:hypothetical protein